VSQQAVSGLFRADHGAANTISAAGTASIGTWKLLMLRSV
jgi:hypothetical protein